VRARLARLLGVEHLELLQLLLCEVGVVAPLVPCPKELVHEQSLRKCSDLLWSPPSPMG
jgi:hypothetical protein